MCRLLSFLLLVELYSFEFHPGPRLRSTEAGERLCTRQYLSLLTEIFIHNSSDTSYFQHQRARGPACPRWPHLWLANNVNCNGRVQWPESHVRAEFCLVFTRVWVINKRKATALKFSHFSTSYNSWIHCTRPLRLTFFANQRCGQCGRARLRAF